MQVLLQPESEFYLPRHLLPSARRFALLSTLGKTQQFEKIARDMDVLAVTAPSLPDLAPNLAMYDACIVFAPDDEAMWLRSLRALYPALRFAGMGADILPALAARKTPLARPAPLDGPPCDHLTVIAATPRSGSSHVADILTELGRGDCREHIRGDIARALASGYRFDLGAAVRLFLHLIAVPETGQAATKLIVSHVFDWLDSRPHLQALKNALQGVKIDMIITDRADRIAQAASSEIALKSGVYQRRTSADGAKIAALGADDFAFDSAFWRFQNYSRQGHFLAALSAWFPRALALDYDRDIAQFSAQALADTLQRAFDWPPLGGPYVARSSHVQRTASDLTPIFQSRLRKGLEDLGFHLAPKGASL